MNNKTLLMLSKQELIDIIQSDRMWKTKAFRKVLSIVTNKIDLILDEQEKCDLMTMSGRKRFEELEKEYKKWSKIQEEL